MSTVPIPDVAIRDRDVPLARSTLPIGTIQIVDAQSSKMKPRPSGIATDCGTIETGSHATRSGFAQ